METLHSTIFVHMPQYEPNQFSRRVEFATQTGSFEEACYHLELSRSMPVPGDTYS